MFHIANTPPAIRRTLKLFLFSAALAALATSAEAAKKVGTVAYDKNGKAYCKFSDGTFIDPPFTATVDKNGVKRCSASIRVVGGTVGMATARPDFRALRNSADEVSTTVKPSASR